MTGRLWGILFVVAVVVVASVGAFRQCEGGAPTLEHPERVSLGRSGTVVTVRAADEGTGLRGLRATLVHAEGEAVLLDHSFPAAGGLSGPSESEPLAISIEPEALGLSEGSAQLKLVATDRSWNEGFSGNRAEQSIPVVIDLRPPRVSIARGIHYLQRGGSGALRYRVSDLGEGGTHGVRVGDHLFSGVALADHPGEYVALFGISVDAADDVGVRVYAEDAAGNRRESEAAVRIKPRVFPESPIRLPDSFMTGKVPELADILGLPPAADGDAVATFRTINEKIREQNEAQIREVIAESSPEPLFSGAFRQMTNSQVTSKFAERRTYWVGGEAVSKATHFGYDLASFRQAPISAGNRGRVVFAGELGIYGSCVLIDHGLGLTSLYGHLSSLEVEVGDEVEAGGLLGFSGATGLAGGDHLHFALLVGDIYVDPIEWWDPKWVREHIDAQLHPPQSESP